MRFDATSKFRRALILPALALLSLLAACAEGPGGPIPYNRPLGAPDAPTVVSLESGYRIAPMDTVTVKVFKAPDMSGDYDVDLTGHISMPLVGEIEAANLTTAQLDERLTAEAGREISRTPRRQRRRESVIQRSVTVDGAVKQAGSFPVAGTTSLMQAVALAGGRSRGRQCAPGGRLPHHRRPTPGRRLRPDGGPPRTGRGPADLSWRHCCRRWFGDQGNAEADLEQHSAPHGLQAVSSA